MIQSIVFVGQPLHLTPVARAPLEVRRAGTGEGPGDFLAAGPDDREFTVAGRADERIGVDSPDQRRLVIVLTRACRAGHPRIQRILRRRRRLQPRLGIGGHWRPKVTLNNGLERDIRIDDRSRADPG